MKKRITGKSALTVMPGVGPSIARDLEDIGIFSVGDLKDKDAETLYNLSNKYCVCTQDKCLLYVFRCAIYFANGGKDSAKLKWWNWK